MEMVCLSCKEIYDAMKNIGIQQTAEREYAYEFQLANKLFIYVKRLLDTQNRQQQPSRLMIHPMFIALKDELTRLENTEFNFEQEGNMNSAFAQFPKCPKSECKDNSTEYGIGVNFPDKNALSELLKFIGSL